METVSKFDVAIVGGGMVGAALAIGLAKQNKSVVIIESTPLESFQPSQPMDIRVSAISVASVKILQQLGVWDTIAEMRICPYRRLETWEMPECRTRFHANELGLEQLGYIVENRVLQLGLGEHFKQYDNLTVLCPDKLADISFSETNQLTLESGKQVQATWVVGADGANSKVLQLTNIGVTAWDYRHHCMLISVETAAEQQDITWQQFTPMGPRSFLPLPGNQASLVWYDSPTRIKQLSSLSNEQLREQVLSHFPSELGDIKVVQHGSFPLTRRHAQQYYYQGCVLVGDAAHTINPLAGQGVNLGFRDVYALLEITADKGELVESTLAEYQKRRRKDNLLMQAGMDVFYKGFSNNFTGIKALRNLAMKVAEHSGPVKKQVLKYALGL